MKKYGRIETKVVTNKEVLEYRVFQLYMALEEIKKSSDIFKEDYETRCKYIDIQVNRADLSDVYVDYLKEKYYIEAEHED